MLGAARRLAPKALRRPRYEAERRPPASSNAISIARRSLSSFSGSKQGGKQDRDQRRIGDRSRSRVELSSFADGVTGTEVSSTASFPQAPGTMISRDVLATTTHSSETPSVFGTGDGGFRSTIREDAAGSVEAYRRLCGAGLFRGHSEHGALALREMDRSPNTTRFSVDESKTGDILKTFSFPSSPDHLLRKNLAVGRGFALEQAAARDWRYKGGGLPHQQHQQLAFLSTEPALKEAEEKKKEETPRPKTWTTTTNRPRPSLKLGTTPVPTPKSSPEVEPHPLEKLKGQTPKNIVRKGSDLLISAFKTVATFLLKLPENIFYYATHPKELREGWIKLRDLAKDEAHHYWVGTKLLWADMQTARKLLAKTLEGSSLTRRERKQLLRTVSDLFRLIPFSMFVLIPFMEFALPFALRIFPNMLPSTYQDSLKAEENMKRELKSRIAMAQFFQETLEEIAKEQKRKASKRKKELEEFGVDLAAEGDVTIENQKDSAASMLEFLEKARSGEPVPPDVIIRYANYFKDDLTLDNMPRMQLVNMCKYMSIPPYGSDSFLRFQLRHNIRVLKEDDQRILWEGIDSLTKMELREACQERGMRSTGMSKEAYKRSLQQWLDLSVNKDLPISLLIMSRTFFLREEMIEPQPVDDSKSLSGLADTISGLDKEILNEVILEVATMEEKQSDPDVRKIKLEVLTKQNELIRLEAEAREAAAKKKEAAEKVKAEAKQAEEAPDSSPSAPPSAETEAATQLSSDTIASSETRKAEAEEAVTEEERKSEEERNLSAAEMDAISQLITDDPVHKEREELDRIKAAMKVGEEDRESAEGEGSPSKEEPELEQKVDDSTETPAVGTSPEPMWSDEADKFAKESLEKMDKEAADEADASTKVTFDDHVKKGSDIEASSGREKEEEETDDPIVARLKKRLESMVDKIEVQLSETKVKIGDKLHYLDKDRDGILTKEEMAEALHQVLKRKISFEEAMEIANEMDENQDGVFTVEELIRWIDEHKLVEFVEEDRDAEMDQIMESQASSQSKEEEDQVAAKK